jgi:hypothetical protein
MHDLHLIRTKGCVLGVLVPCRMSLAGFIMSTLRRLSWSPSTVTSGPGVFGSQYCNEMLGRKKHCVGAVLEPRHGCS